MKIKTIAFFAFSSIGLSAQAQQNKTFSLITTVRKTLPNSKRQVNALNINQKDVDAMPESLKALAAYYSCVAGSDCMLDDDNDLVCELTTSLKLGKQHSDEQFRMLGKWFEDADLRDILKGKFDVGVPGSNSFSDYSYLTFIKRSDTVEIKYKVDFYNSGKSQSKTYSDLALIKDNPKIVFLKRTKQLR